MMNYVMSTVEALSFAKSVNTLRCGVYSLRLENIPFRFKGLFDEAEDWDCLPYVDWIDGEVGVSFALKYWDEYLGNYESYKWFNIMLPSGWRLSDDNKVLPPKQGVVVYKDDEY